MFDNYRKSVDNRLEEILKPYECEYKTLLEAMNYSVSAGGKRIRPILMMEFANICCTEPLIALDFACALEMIHTYSLIHDDLPCMDNDDFRRGRPSCHKAFGESTALLAGDALLTEAFTIALSTKNVENDRIIKALSVLSQCAGINGMIGGQVIDLKYEGKDIPLDSIKSMYKMKTAALLVAAAKIGCILGGADDTKINAAGDFAENVGLAFQIKDDILDVTSTYDDLGKPIGSDKSLNKSTIVSYLGIDKSQEMLETVTNNALSSLDIFGSSADKLKTFAKELCKRKK